MNAMTASQDQEPGDQGALEFLNDEATQVSARDMPNLDICVATNRTDVSSSLNEAAQDGSTSRSISMFSLFIFV